MLSTSNDPFDLGPCTLILTMLRDTSSRPLMCCMYAAYEVIQPNRNGVAERTLQKLVITGVTFVLNDRRDPGL